MKKLLPFAILLLAGCSSAAADNLHEPLDSSGARQSPLHFGVRVTPDPKDNPISPPERFEGYHAGVDFEVGADELEKEVPVYAICSGKVSYSGFAEGYGGLIVQLCTLDGQQVNVIYGHLTLSSLVKQGKKLSAGDKLGTLGEARTHDADGNRKHLHLGIHKGKAVSMLGYVQDEAALEEFIDPLSLLPVSLFEKLGPDIVPYWKTESINRSSSSL